MQNKFCVSARCATVPLCFLCFGSPRYSYKLYSCSLEDSQKAGACWQNAPAGVQPIGFWPSPKSTATRRREMDCSSEAIHQQAKEGRDQQLDKWCLSHPPFLFASSVCFIFVWTYLSFLQMGCLGSSWRFLDKQLSHYTPVTNTRDRNWLHLLQNKGRFSLNWSSS